MNKYIEKLQELLKQVNKKHLIAAAAAVVIFLLGFVTGCSCSGRHGGDDGPELGVSEALDSFALVMPEGSQIVARFTDKRHSLFYLNSGRLMRFNAKTKMLDEIVPSQMNSDARVYYKDGADCHIQAEHREHEPSALYTASHQARCGEKRLHTTCRRSCPEGDTTRRGFTRGG